MSYFSANGICAGYGKQTIINDISFSLDAGCLMGIIGANGSGKTTLLKALCGILPHEGTCLLNGTVLEKLSARQLAHAVSYIPQRSGISIDISALDVVLMGFNSRLKLLEQPTRAMAEAAVQALRQVGLAGMEHKNYLHLSEGQKQLCILARTLVCQKKLLLLDEPESALDFRFRYEMLALLRKQTAESLCSAVVTLHDPTLALNFCDKLMLLQDGRILSILSPQEDALEKTEQALGQIYGPVSLQRSKRRNGQEVLTMLKEETP